MPRTANTTYHPVVYAVLAILVLGCVYVLYNIFVLHYAGQDSVYDHTTANHYARAPESGDQSIPVITVTAFLDYGCPYCRDIHPTITQAVKTDGRVKYIPRIIPFLDSVSARFAYAAGQQGQFFDAHDVLMSRAKPLSNDDIILLAQALGLNTDRLKADMYSEDIRRQIAENITLYNNTGGTATPYVLIGDDIQYIPQGRMPDVDDFLEMFAQARTQ